MIYNDSEIKEINPVILFKKYNVTEKDIVYYNNLILEGKEDQAIDEFIEKYVVPVVDIYSDKTREYMRQAEKGQMKVREKNKIERNVIILTSALSLLLNSNFKQYINKVHADSIFKKMLITNPDIKKTILDTTLKEFEMLTTNSLNNTQNNVLRNIRNIQRETIIFNQGIGKKKLTQKLIRQEVGIFKDKVRERLPGFYKGLDNGQILLTSTFDPEKPITRYLKLNNYIETSVETTLLNIDRTSVEVAVRAKEEPKGNSGVNVVQFLQISKRKLKTGKERKICQEILRKKIMGKSLLALDKETGILLGIMTVEEAKTTGDKSMGPHCRHGIRPLGNSYKKRLLGRIRRLRREAT